MLRWDVLTLSTTGVSKREQKSTQELFFRAVPRIERRDFSWKGKPAPLKKNNTPTVSIDTTVDYRINVMIH